MARRKQETLVIFPDLFMGTKKLTDAQFGALMRAVFAFRFEGTDSAFDDPMVDMAFDFIKPQLIRYQEVCETNRRNRAQKETTECDKMQNAECKMQNEITECNREHGLGPRYEGAVSEADWGSVLNDKVKPMILTTLPPDLPTANPPPSKREASGLQSEMQQSTTECNEMQNAECNADPVGADDHICPNYAHLTFEEEIKCNESQRSATECNEMQRKPTQNHNQNHNQNHTQNHTQNHNHSHTQNQPHTQNHKESVFVADKPPEVGWRDEASRIRKVPSCLELEEFREQEGLMHVDIMEFWSYYQLLGWKDERGRPIGDWRALLRRWDKNRSSA